MKEKSSIQESSREDGIWWKPFMRNVCENHSGAVTPKIGGTIRVQGFLSVAVCLR